MARQRESLAPVGPRPAAPLVGPRKLLKIHVPDSFTSERIEVDRLPGNWFHEMELTRGMGDAWLESKVTPLHWVPSVVAPETSNLLVNPLHRQSSRIQIVDVQEHAFDERLR